MGGELVLPAFELNNWAFWGGIVGASILTFLVGEPLKLIAAWIINKISKTQYDTMTMPKIWRLLIPVPAAFIVNWAIGAYFKEMLWNEMPFKVIVCGGLSVWVYNFFKSKIDALKESGKIAK
jgi:hypothetical protein